MKQEEIIEIPEKDTILRKNTPSSFRSPKVFIPYAYIIGVLWFMGKNPYYYGLATSIYIKTYYILPFTCLFVPLFAFITVIPFMILRILGAPHNTYPAPKIDTKQSILITLLSTAFITVNMLNYISYFMDIMYYLRFRYYTVEFAKSNMQNLTAITFFFALIFTRKLWFKFATLYYQCHQDAITMWKFSILQINQRGFIQV